MIQFKLYAVFFLTLATIEVNAQKVYTKNGSISFFSKASIENISADNNEVVSVLDENLVICNFGIGTEFHFKKSLMEEHFNENYLESSKYPKAVFKGKITDLSKVNFAVDGNYPVQVSGDMTIHGVTAKLSAPGTITVKNGVAQSTSTFKIKLADYKVSIPAVVKDNIAEVVDVTVSCVYNQTM